jgi:hypothetical protein
MAELGEPPRVLRRSAEVFSLLTVAGLLLYGTVWSCYNSFYGTFGLEPEDVGVTYARTISRAAIGFLTLLLIIGLVLFLLVNPLKNGQVGPRCFSRGSLVCLRGDIRLYTCRVFHEWLASRQLR